MQETATYLYDAFISYSRKDSAFAIGLQRNLERSYRNLETQLKGTKKRIFIALDSEDLDASEDLSEEIKKKIDNSKHLVVVCSPHSQKSVWVNKEIQYFKTSRKSVTDRQIIAILWDLEEPVTPDCFPAELVDDGKLPLALDARKTYLKKWKVSYREHYKFNVLYQVFSKILDVPFATVKNRQGVFERKKRKRVITLAASIAIVIAGILAAVLIKGARPEFVLLRKFRNPLLQKTYSGSVTIIDPDRFAKGDDNGNIYLVKDTGIYDSLTGLRGIVNETVLFKNHYLLGVSAQSDSLICWDIYTRKLAWAFRNTDSSSFKRISISKLERIIALSDENGKIWLLDENHNLVDTLKETGQGKGQLFDIDFGDSEKQLAVCYQNDPVTVYDFSGNKPVFTHCHRNSPFNMWILMSGKNLIYAQWNGTANKNLLTVSTFDCQKKVLAHSSASFGEIFAIENTNKIIYSNWEGKIAVVNSSSGKELTYLSMEEKDRFFESELFYVGYNDKLKIVVVYTNANVYVYRLRWVSLFDIPMEAAKYFD